MGWLSTANVSQDTDLPVNILKENFAELIYAQFSYSESSSQTPVSFKCVNITPIFTSKYRNHKNNYRLVTIIPLVSKIFEKIMKKQLSIYLENIISKFPCDFRKGLSTQHCLTGASKTFDCLCHNLLIAKLNAYSLSLSVLKLTHNYL